MYSNNIHTFIKLYNEIDEFLRSKYRIDTNEGFSNVIRIGKNDFKQDDDYYKMITFAKLRNLITHNNDMIVEIHPKVVNSMMRIHKNFMPSQSVFSKFNRKVTTFETNDNLTDILRVIKEMDYSQFPVYQEKQFVGLITENGITKWLAKNFEEQIFSTDYITAWDILEIEENKDNVVFIDRNLTVEDAKDIFSFHLRNGKPTLDALLITHSGKNTEELLGIITRWDVIESE